MSLVLGCTAAPPSSPSGSTAPSPSTSSGTCLPTSTGVEDTAASCDALGLGPSPDRHPACATSTASTPDECTLGSDEHAALFGVYETDWGCDQGKPGRFTRFDDKRVTFVPDDGSPAPQLFLAGGPSELAALPDLVAAGDVVLYLRFSEGGYFTDTLAAVTDPSGKLLLLSGNTLGTIAGWTASFGDGADTCPALPATGDGVCQECRANQPIRVTGPDFDAQAWPNRKFSACGYALSVGWAFRGGGGYLCVDGPGMDQVAWTLFASP